MTEQQPVTHPPVTHPAPTAEKPPASPTDNAAKPTARPASGRGRSSSWRMPPPKVIAAALLVVVALELLLWQVAGVFWGVLVHAVLAGLVLAVLAGLLVWRRKAARRRPTGQAATGSGTAAGRRSPLGRLLGRSGGAGGKGRRLFGRSGTAGGKSTGGRGLLGRLGGGSARRAGTGGRGTPGASRSGGLLGRLGGRKASPGRTASASTGRKGGLGLLGGGRSGKNSAGRAGSAPAGTRKGATAATSKPAKRRSFWDDFMSGVRQAQQKKPSTAQRKPSPGPTAEPKKNTPATPKAEENPQQPDKEQLVKEAVDKAAKASPATVAPQRTGGTSMGDINKVRAAADEFAAALKDYDPEDMHQLVRDMPHMEQILVGISQGFEQVASRAESEWPVAAPVVEGYRSIGADVRAAAGTAGETRGSLRRENETDIERGEAPRHGSINVERRWNV